MKTIIHKIRNSLAISALCMLSISNSVSAAPGLIENAPLFLSNRAEPNIFFMMDDSGSMDADMMTPENIIGWGGVMVLDPAWPNDSSFGAGVYTYLFGDTSTNDPDNHNSWNGTVAENAFENDLILPTQKYIDDNDSLYPDATIAANALLEGVWRGRASVYNSLYYDPNVDYKPWGGVNEAGNPFPDYTSTSEFSTRVTNVPLDPYFTASPTYDLATDKTIRTDNVDGSDSVSADVTGPPAIYAMVLTPMAYWVWKDNPLSLNGLVDPHDPHNRIDINVAPECGASNSIDDQLAGSGCILRTRDEEIRNFTNWFVYHRKRDYAAKFALSQVISPIDKVRMGIATINNNKSNAQLRTMLQDNSTGDKRTLLNALFSNDSRGGTPLRNALNRVGRYYECLSGGPNFSGSSDLCGIDKNPIDGAGTEPGICQQNFTVLISDGERNGGDPGIGDADDNNSSFTDTYYPSGTAVSGTFKFDDEPYADNNTNASLADVAMHYYERDLDGGLDNRVPIICGVDENPRQHMVTYSVGFGVSGNVTAPPTHPQLGYADNCLASPTPGDFTWKSSTTNANFYNGNEKIDDLLHAAFNGRGEYLSAQNPQAFTDSLNSTIRSIASRTGAASAVSFNSNSLAAGGTAYFARFNSANWQGELAAFEILADGTLDVTPKWKAHKEIEEQPLGERAIVTFDRTPLSYGAIPFRDINDMPSKIQNDLSVTTANAIDTSASGLVLAQERLNYIRGNHGCEESYKPADTAPDVHPCAASAQNKFRDRLLSSADAADPTRFKLGDLIHSAPVYVAEPPARINGSDPFGATGDRHRDFKSGATNGAFTSGFNAVTRTPMLYVGGNDGMLHAIIAEGPNAGKELWAYIPNSLFNEHPTNAKRNPGLHQLTETGYDHNYYVDLTPTVADAYVDPHGKGINWHTVLVGGFRAGGRGIFAVDVTDPDAIIFADEQTGSFPSNPSDTDTTTDIYAGSERETRAAEKIMWEFTYEDDIDMGLSYSEPHIVALGTSTGIEYYVIFGNGYNSHRAETDVLSADATLAALDSSASGQPLSSKLFILKLEGPRTNGGVWKEGINYWKLDTELLNGNDKNGMSTPAVADSDGDSIADYVYAGDLHGFLWAFDVRGSSSSAGVYKKAGKPSPLFTATDGDDGLAGSGNRQPITSQPSLDFNRSVPTVVSGGSKNIPNLMVYFGTGSYLTSADLNDSTKQSFYAVWDSGEANLKSGGYTVNRSLTTSSDLVQQTIVLDTVNTQAGPLNVRTIDPENPVTYGTDFGWFHDLPETGERVVADSLAVAGLVFYITITPNKSPCDFGGTSWLMAVKSNDGTAPDASLTDYDGDGAIGDPDLTIGSNHAAAGTQLNALATDSVIAPAGAGVKPGLTCPPGTKKSLKVTTLSDGSTRTDVECLPLGFKPGRHSWRELRF